MENFDIKNYPNVTVLDHPLLKHKITLLRDVNTGTNEFRHLVKEIAIMEGYEALRDLPTEMIEVQTPIEKAMEPVVSGKKLCFVPILRAGLGMVDGLLELVPSAKVGHIGLYRDEVTHKPHEYYCKLPYNLEERDIYLLDPMFATGGSALGAVELLEAAWRQEHPLHRHHRRTGRHRCLLQGQSGYSGHHRLSGSLPQ
jgi:uracil phosphoribosyltransferase